LALLCALRLYLASRWAALGYSRVYPELYLLYQALFGCTQSFALLSPGLYSELYQALLSFTKLYQFLQ